MGEEAAERDAQPPHHGHRRPTAAAGRPHHCWKSGWNLQGWSRFSPLWCHTVSLWNISKCCGTAPVVRHLIQMKKILKEGWNLRRGLFTGILQIGVSNEGVVSYDYDGGHWSFTVC